MVVFLNNFSFLEIFSISFFISSVGEYSLIFAKISLSFKFLTSNFESKLSPLKTVLSNSHLKNGIPPSQITSVPA